jgi:serine protease
LFRPNTPALCALAAALLLSLFPDSAVRAQDTMAPAEPARVIVKFRTDAPSAAFKSLGAPDRPAARARMLGTRLGRPLRAGAAISDSTQVIAADGISSADLAQQLAQQSDVEYAVPDRRRQIVTAPNDPLYASIADPNGPAVGQWYLRAPSGAVKSPINVEPAWDITTGSSSVIVAVIDTGVRYEHPDLRTVATGGNLLPGYDMITDPAGANDGDGRDPDASDPGDWVTAADIQGSGSLFHCQPTPSNSSWHGTQVSGIIAALTNNSTGMASVARNVRILPVRALGKCGGFDSDIIAGMRWAAGLSVPGTPFNTTPAQVINLSLGGEGPCEAPYVQAVADITAKGTVIVAAAGNSAGHSVQAPGNCTGVIGVAGLRHVGTKVGFSDLGPEIAISAPGGNCVNTTAADPCLYPILTTSNSGSKTPVDSIYTDSFNASLGTSFSSPLVAGTVALMLSANPAMTPQQVRAALQSSARTFPTTSADNEDQTVPFCAPPQFDGSGDPIDQLECICNTSTCGAGMLDAGAAVFAAKFGALTAVFNAQGLWWASPAASESGWGMNFAHQGDTIFVTWFTYDASGKPTWFAAELHKSGPNIYSGAIFTTTGPAFNAVPFNPAQVVETTVGNMTVAFSPPNDAVVNYTVNGLSRSKLITREVFGPLPACVWGQQNDLTLATANYQDLWWRAPAGSESGWGINFTHQGDTIFATWFTYDRSGKPWWLIALLNKTASGTYAGNVSTVTGPPYFALPFNPALVVETIIGTASVTFSDGNTASFAYTINDGAGAVSQTKPLTRQVFAAPGTVCQ